eukprot:TRINITY_DN33927_c0_g1_i1.p1 TRINITY_DN33927_c0_g1~~TRINITY_DN33927_c0_g1_i1.p1  ORF type:complete len:149 (-),score=12.19 TRINITY_DN33927_c0_g1_i1:60-506(-)
MSVTAIERSPMAAKLTKKNAEKLGLESRLKIIEERVDENTTIDDEFHAIVSNPPYILRKDLMNLAPEISLYEDLRALDGGAEGLDVILAILKLSQRVLSVGSPIFLEVDPCHSLLLPNKLIDAQLPFHIKSVITDFSGKDRFLILEKS